MDRAQTQRWIYIQYVCQVSLNGWRVDGGRNTRRRQRNGKEDKLLHATEVLSGLFTPSLIVGQFVLIWYLFVCLFDLCKALKTNHFSIAFMILGAGVVGKELRGSTWHKTCWQPGEYGQWVYVISVRRKRQMLDSERELVSGKGEKHNYMRAIFLSLHRAQEGVNFLFLNAQLMPVLVWKTNVRKTTLFFTSASGVKWFLTWFKKALKYGNDTWTEWREMKQSRKDREMK